MTENEFVELLDDALEALEQLGDVSTTRTTFRDAGLLTMNSGMVVTLDDGQEFQVTVVRSR